MTKLRRALAGSSHAALRIVAGFLFAQHGAQKLFGVLGGETQALASMMGAAGIIELCGGIMISVGLFTPVVAYIASGQMAAAYFMAHVPRGFWPILNGGEAAALFCFVFLYFATHGAGRFSIDRLRGKG